MSTNKVFVSLLATGVLAACGGSDAPSDAGVDSSATTAPAVLQLIQAVL